LPRRDVDFGVDIEGADRALCAGHNYTLGSGLFCRRIVSTKIVLRQTREEGGVLQFKCCFLFV
jgi:hypothetical protein